jgi:hypothetical protein
MLYVGMDVHKRTLQICVLDKSGNRKTECKLDNDRESLIRFF